MDKQSSLVFHSYSKDTVNFWKNSKTAVIWSITNSLISLLSSISKHTIRCTLRPLLAWLSNSTAHRILLHILLPLTQSKNASQIPVELFQILKDDAVKVLHSICQQIWKTQQWPQDWKRAVFISIPKKGNPKECSNYCTIALISHASKIMLKILQARFQQYVNCEFPDVQAGFRKRRATRDQIANIHWIIEKAKSSRKTPTSALLTIPKPLTVWITTNCGKFFKKWEYQTSWPASWEICIQVKKQQLELDMEQQTGSK